MGEITRKKELVLNPEKSEVVNLGRSWNEDRVRQVYELALLGLTDEQMCHVMGIGKDTLIRWKENNEEFHNALYEGKIGADQKVAAALYKRAVGYEVEEDHVSVFKGEAIVTTVKKHVPPDPWSAVKWLSCRQRSLWSEVHRMEVTNTNVNIMKFDATGITDAELELMKKIGLRGQLREQITSGDISN